MHSSHLSFTTHLLIKNDETPFFAHKECNLWEKLVCKEIINMQCEKHREHGNEDEKPAHLPGATGKASRKGSV
jgi:hypothetical protein